jgi:hypothetical protein
MSFNSGKRISRSALCTVNYGKEKSYIYVNKTPVYKEELCSSGFLRNGSGNFLPTIRDKLSFLSSGLKNPPVVPKRR